MVVKCLYRTVFHSTLKKILKRKKKKEDFVSWTQNETTTKMLLKYNYSECRSIALSYGFRMECKKKQPQVPPIAQDMLASL